MEGNCGFTDGNFDPGSVLSVIFSRAGKPFVQEHTKGYFDSDFVAKLNLSCFYIVAREV